MSLETKIKETEVQIESLRETLDFLKSLTGEEKLTPELVLKISKTVLTDDYETIKKLIKNTFPEADSIRNHTNHINFMIQDYILQISKKTGKISVYTSWYIKDKTFEYSENKTIEAMKDYFCLVDSGADWYSLARKRYLKNASKLKLFFIWWFNLRWKSVDREEWKNIFFQYEADYQKSRKDYEKKMLTIREKARVLLTVIVPIMKKYSFDFGKFDNNEWEYTVDEIGEYEKNYEQYNPN